MTSFSTTPSKGQPNRRWLPGLSFNSGRYRSTTSAGMEKGFRSKAEERYNYRLKTNKKVNQMFQKTSLTFLLLAFGFVNNAFADLVFSAAPRGDEATETATYQPLANAMSQVLHVKVVYVFPHNFIEYSLNMQKGDYDIVFDGPQFAQWRVTHLKHIIIANLPEELQFYVVMHADAKASSPKDLLNESVCAQLAPQLGTLQLLQKYSDGVVEPEMHMVQGEYNVLEEFRAGKCIAAVLRDKTFDKLASDERQRYKVIYKTPLTPNDAITVGPKLSSEQIASLEAMLTNPAQAKSARSIFDRFSKDAVAFKKVDPANFKGLDSLLLLNYGWDKPEKAASQ